LCLVAFFIHSRPWGSFSPFRLPTREPCEKSSHLPPKRPIRDIGLSGTQDHLAGPGWVPQQKDPGWLWIRFIKFGPNFEFTDTERSFEPTKGGLSITSSDKRPHCFAPQLLLVTAAAPTANALGPAPAPVVPAGLSSAAHLWRQMIAPTASPRCDAPPWSPPLLAHGCPTGQPHIGLPFSLCADDPSTFYRPWTPVPPGNRSFDPSALAVNHPLEVMTVCDCQLDQPSRSLYPKEQRERGVVIVDSEDSI
jgi:hypothetical protein